MWKEMENNFLYKHGFAIALFMLYFISSHPIQIREESAGFHMDIHYYICICAYDLLRSYVIKCLMKYAYDHFFSFDVYICMC